MYTLSWCWNRFSDFELWSKLLLLSEQERLQLQGWIFSFLPFKKGYVGGGGGQGGGVGAWIRLLVMYDQSWKSAVIHLAGDCMTNKEWFVPQLNYRSWESVCLTFPSEPPPPPPWTPAAQSVAGCTAAASAAAAAAGRGLPGAPVRGRLQLSAGQQPAPLPLSHAALHWRGSAHIAPHLPLTRPFLPERVLPLCYLSITDLIPSCYLGCVFF